MSTRRVAALSHALIVCGGVAGAVLRVEAQSPLPPVRRDFPLNCRGGAPLAFDTLLVVSDSHRVRLSLTFNANPTAAGLEGQGLQPGSCAWVDRPLSEAEPRRMQFAIGATDSAPQRTVGDSGMYWGFLASDSDSGFITGVGYRHWHASSPPVPWSAPAVASTPAAASRRSFPLPFDVRYLPLLAIGIGVIVGMPATVLIGRGSGWRRLADRYPDRNTGRGRSFSSGQLVMRMTLYRMGVRFTMDESHLHVAMSVLARMGHAPLSIPWSDIEAAPDEWPWFPFKGDPMVRLTLVALPDIRILIKVRDAERIVEGSGGRLSIRDPLAHTVAAHR